MNGSRKRRRINRSKRRRRISKNRKRGRKRKISRNIKRRRSRRRHTQATSQPPSLILLSLVAPRIALGARA